MKMIREKMKALRELKLRKITDRRGERFIEREREL